MSDAQRFRAPASWSGDSSIWTTAVAAVACFLFSAGVVLYWDTISTPSRWLAMLTGSDHVPRASKDRLGQAETAPVLQSCVTRALLPHDPGPKYLPWMIWVDLNAGIQMGILPADSNAPREHGRVELTQRWGNVASCVYQQNTSALCDIDNRVVAVQSAATFVRLADEIVAKPRNFAATAEDVADLAATKQRVLELVKPRVQSGALIVSDFGAFVPKSLRDVLSATRTTANACAPAR